jgi:hypothetical protein
LRLVKHDMAVMHDAAEALGLQIFMLDTCEKMIGHDSKTLVQPVEIAYGLRPASHAPRVAVYLFQVFVGAAGLAVGGHMRTVEWF